MASPQNGGAGAALLGRAYDLYQDGMFRMNPRDMVRSGEIQRILEETAFDLPEPASADGAGDLRLQAAAELMLERHSMLHIVERENAFRVIIENLRTDDGQLDSRDNVEILQSVTELVDGVENASDRGELLERMRVIFEGARAELSAETATRIASVMEDLASEAAFELANDGGLGISGAAEAWAMLVEWRTPEQPDAPSDEAAADEASTVSPLAERYNGLSLAESTELLRLFDVASANLSNQERLEFTAFAHNDIAAAEFDGWANLDQAIRSQAYDAHRALAQAPTDPESAIANLAALSELLESDTEMSNRAKTRL
ncbi:MAG: hypothetical protein AAFQ82_28525, partial [Myxococcota bacterium]